MPIGKELTDAIESGEIDPGDDSQARGRILTDKFKWDAADATKIWCFGPDTTGPNVLVDLSTGVQNLNEIRNSCVEGFQWATPTGVLIGERMRGVRINLLDATVRFDYLPFAQRGIV